MSALLQNTLNSIPQLFTTAVDALYSLPPPVVEEFWSLTATATKVDGQASAYSVRAQDNADRRQAELLFVLALRVLRDALGEAAMPDALLNKELNDRGADENLKELLLGGGHFHETLYLLTRIVTYVQGILHHYDDPHPVFMMDANMLLNAVERLTGYVPYVPANPVTPSLPQQPVGDPRDRDFMYLVRAVAGDPHTWFPTNNPFSEFNMFKPFNPEAPPNTFAGNGRPHEDLIYYLNRVWCGATARERADLLRRQKEYWKTAPKNRTKTPQDFADFPDIQKDDDENEIWLFINGVATDQWIVQLNAEHLAHLFKRKIHILHNYTLGLDRDLRECVRGRTLEEKTTVARQLLLELKGLVEKKGKLKVVIVAHSQGTIIASEMVKRLKGLTLSEADPALLERMEVYNFAFCADEFPKDTCRHVEHFVNDRDFVPSLSIVPKNFYDVAGCIFRRARAAGHLLGAHYLEGFAHGKYKGDPAARQSVLFRYLDGKNYGRILS